MPFQLLTSTDTYFVGSNYVSKEYSLTYSPDQHQRPAQISVLFSSSRNEVKFQVEQLNFEVTQKKPVPGLDIYIEKNATMAIKEALVTIRDGLPRGTIYNTEQRNFTDPTTSPMTIDQVRFTADPIPLGWCKINEFKEVFAAQNCTIKTTRTNARINDPRLFIDFEHRPGKRPKSIHFGFRIRTSIIEQEQAGESNLIEFVFPISELSHMLNSMNYGLGWFRKFGI